MRQSGKVIAYFRVSTKAQGASGLGLEAQREAVGRFLACGSWVLVGEYQDIESGTRKGNARPELSRAIAHAKRARATLIIAKLDRLARNVAFVSSLMEAGVDFVAADNPQANKLTIHILAAVAEAEADAISKRTKEALTAAKARGVTLGKPENLTPAARSKGAAATRADAIKDYAHVAQEILKMRESGQTHAAIAQALNAAGHRTRTGATFQDVTVRRIIERLPKGNPSTNATSQSEAMQVHAENR